MVLLFSLAPILAASSTPRLTIFFAEALLDLVGVLAASWMLWTLAWLDSEGRLLSAFRLIAFGGLSFALLHVLDSLLRQGQLVSGRLIGLLHLGTMLLAMVVFVLGLARLADAVVQWHNPNEGGASLRLWPLAVTAALSLEALSFILYGFSPEAVNWSTLGLNIGLILLTAVCAVQVFRARLGGTVGRALWLALVGLLVFSLVHPLQSWLTLAQILQPTPYASILHRLFVIPAFLFFCASIAQFSRTLVHKQREAIGLGISASASLARSADTIRRLGG